MRVVETFASLQGESTHAGRKCFFIRLSGCNLDCSYCDTLYGKAFDGGVERSVDSLVQEVLGSAFSLVEITGGEPLCSPETPRLCQALLDARGVEYDWEDLMPRARAWTVSHNGCSPRIARQFVDFIEGETAQQA